MKKQSVTLAIPTPCHENWQQMTPAEQGRFCQSCQKTVIDFTAKTDREVASFFKQGSTNTCGRFRQDQLHRPMYAEQPTGFSTRWRALGIMVPGLLLGSWAQAQSQRQTMPVLGMVACPRPSVFAHVPDTKGEVAVAPSISQMLLGDTIIVEQKAPFTVCGKVVDSDTGEPLIGAFILVNGTGIGTSTNMDGLYEISIPKSTAHPSMTVSARGYSMVELTITQAQHQVDVKLKIIVERMMIAGNIAVTNIEETFYNQGKQKVQRWFRPLQERLAKRREARLLKKEPVASLPSPPPPPSPALPEALFVVAYPNPFGNNLTLRFDSPVAERLTIRLMDMQGHTLFLQTYEAMKGPQVLTLDIQGVHLPPGQYLLELSSKAGLHFAGVVVKA